MQNPSGGNPNRPLRPYPGYGLHFRSNIDLPWPSGPLRGKPDVSILRGTVPRSLASAVDKCAYWQTAPDALLLDVDKVARCLVFDRGRRVRVALAQGGGDAIVCLVDSILAACLQMRGILALHGSAIATAEGAVLFVGPVGAGKSTLSAALIDRGYSLLADGIVGIVAAEAGAPLALAGFPSVRLWPEALRDLDQQWRRSAGAPLRPGVELCAIPARRFHDDALVVRAVYVLSSVEVPETAVKPLAPVQGFAALAENTYRFRFLRGLGREASHFRAVSALVRHAGVSRLLRPKIDCLPATLAASLADRLPPCP